MTDTNYLKGIGNKKESFKFLLKTIKPQWFKLVLVILLTVLSAAFELLSISLIFPLLNSLNPTDNDSQINMPIAFMNTYFSGFTDTNKIRFIAVALLILQSSKYCLTALIQIVIAKIQINVDKNLRLLVVNDLLYSEIKFINKTPVAENFTILNTFTGHTGRLALSITSVINPVIMVFVYMFALITISWQLTLISALFVAISTYGMGFITTKTSEIAGKRNRAAVKLNQLGFETISAIKHIQLFTKEKHAFKQYQEGTNNVNNLVYKAAKLKALSSPLFQISNLSSVVILLVVATIIFSDQQEFILGIILTYLFVMLRLIGPLQTLNTQRIAIAGQIPSMNALKYFFDRKDKKHYAFGQESLSEINKIHIKNVSFQYEQNNPSILNNINLEIEKGTMTAIVGPSGSGKSTLILQTLFNALNLYLNNNKSRKVPLPFKGIKGIELIDKIIDIDQSPIGRTPRSNPATYTGAFGPIRDWFANLPESKTRGYKPGRYSFNVKGGRCETCEGDGVITYEMHFLPDVYVPCDACKGSRYNRETLEIKFKNKNIADILDMTVDEGCEFFQNIPAVYSKLLTLKHVGLGYIKVGQQATTLSGGEAQRIKLAKELSKRSTGRTLYILDEPTTGLHSHDIKKLLEILKAFVNTGNTVIVIEHNLDVIKTADWIVDMGPEGGDEGGKIIAEGSPEKVAEMKHSDTGKFLKNLINNRMKKTA